MGSLDSLDNGSAELMLSNFFEEHCQVNIIIQLQPLSGKTSTFRKTPKVVAFEEFFTYSSDTIKVSITNSAKDKGEAIFELSNSNSDVLPEAINKAIEGTKKTDEFATLCRKLCEFGLKDAELRFTFLLTNRDEILLLVCKQISPSSKLPKG